MSCAQEEPGLCLLYLHSLNGRGRPPERVWRPYGTDLLPSPAEALAQPLRAFPSWFLRFECARCGKVRASDAHRDMQLHERKGSAIAL